MERKKLVTGSPYYGVGGLVCAACLALVQEGAVLECGGVVRYVVEAGLLRAGGIALAFCAALGFGLYHIYMYVHHYRPAQGNPPRKKGRVVSLVLLVAALPGLLSVLGSGWIPMDSLETTPYLPGKVLPLMAQLEEEAPDLSVQQVVPASDGVATYRHWYDPKTVILRQDAGDGAWYHIFYRKIPSAKLTQAYAQALMEEAQEMGCTLEPLGAGVYWDNDPIGEGKPAEVLLLWQGDEMVKVTYVGPLDLHAHGAAWSQALFPDSKG